MMTRNDKNAVIADLKEKISSANALFLTNLIGVGANDAVEVRKKVREANGSVVITRNTLFGKAAEGTYAEELLKDLKGTNAVAFAFEDAPGVAKVIYESSKDLESITLGKGFLRQEPLEEAQVVELAKLPSRDEMLATLLATFQAPISAFARLANNIKEAAEEQGIENLKDFKVAETETAE